MIAKLSPLLFITKGNGFARFGAGKPGGGSVAGETFADVRCRFCLKVRALVLWHFVRAREHAAVRDNSPHHACGGLPQNAAFVRCSRAMSDRDDQDEPRGAGVLEASRDRALASDDDLPVVARLVVEIRSDGRRTVARGAIEDVSSGVKTAVVARGESPVRLAVDLARAIARLPRLAARGAVRGLLARRGDDRDRREQ